MPVRSYLYLLIAEIEMLLAEIIKSTVTNDQIEASLRSDQKKPLRPSIYSKPRN